MTKYIAYVNISNMPLQLAKKHVEDVENGLRSTVLEQSDKLVVLAVNSGETRVEILSAE